MYRYVNDLVRLSMKKYLITSFLILFEFLLKTILEFTQIFKFLGVFKIGLTYTKINMPSFLFIFMMFLLIWISGLLLELSEKKSKFYMYSSIMITTFIFSVGLDYLFEESIVTYFSINSFQFNLSMLMGVFGFIYLVYYYIKKVFTYGKNYIS